MSDVVEGDRTDQRQGYGPARFSAFSVPRGLADLPDLAAGLGQSASKSRSPGAFSRGGGAALALVSACATALALGALIGLVQGSPFILAFVSVAIFSAIASFVVVFLPFHTPSSFGLANTVTTFRAAIVSALAALLIVETQFPLGPVSEPFAWFVAGLAVFCLSLDGFDGWLARRQGTASRFGARYDMEVDAALALVLAGLVFMSGKTGIAILGLGLMRYLFLAAAEVFPVLKGELAPSMRRKTVCVLQIAVLCALTTPIFASPLSDGLAWIGFAALLYSFGVDIVTLVRRGHPRTTKSPGSAPASETRP